MTVKANYGSIKRPASDQQKTDLTLGQLFMIAMGGIIGSGIFVASGIPIRLAGPGVVVSFLLGGFIVGLVMVILGEMTAYEPSTGSFSQYANKYLGPMMGFITGWMYWSSGIFAMATEVAAASLLSRWWFPSIPLWVFSLCFSVLITFLNFMDLKGFGKAESWLSSIKIIALLLFLLIGGFVLLSAKAGQLHLEAVHWNTLFPAGWFGIYSSMLLVIFAYAGMQNMIIAAANVVNPSRKIPLAIMISIVSVTVLYCGSLAVIVGIIPWNTVNPSTSPFVTVIEKIGIPFAGGILNFVVISAVLSSMNTTMFGNSRMLQSLALRKEAPGIFLKNNNRGVPVYSLIANSVFLGVFVVFAYVLPHNIFIYVSSSSVFITLFNWTVIIITYLAFRKSLGYKEGQGRNRKYIVKPVLALVLLFAVISSVPFVPQQIPGMIAGIVLLVLFFGGYFIYFRSSNYTAISKDK